MSEPALTLLRLLFLVLLWVFVLVTVVALRRDLRAPRDARPLVPDGRGEIVAAGLPTATARPKATRQRRRGPRSLVVVEGALTGTVIPLGTAPVTIGRAPDSTLVLDDDYASNHHALFTPVDGHWVVEDRGSTNGTWLGRARLTTPTRLEVGQQVRVGRTTLELRK